MRWLIFVAVLAAVSALVFGVLGEGGGKAQAVQTVTITAEANGFLAFEPGIDCFPVPNGSFTVSCTDPQSANTFTGDGIDDVTTWTFAFTGDAGFPAFKDCVGPLTSAGLTLTLTPRGPQLDTDTVGITGVGGIPAPGVETLYNAAPNGLTRTITVDFLDPSFSAIANPAGAVAILGVFDAAVQGQIPMVYQDDATISFAELELTIECPPVPCVAPPAGLISWWPGDVNADDISDGNPGTFQGGVALVNGKVGPAFSFDGVDGFVLVSPSANLNITGDVTVDLWARRTVFLGGNATMVSKGVGFAPVDLPSVYVLRFVNDELQGVFERANGTNVVVTGPTVFDNGFHHYAYVRSGNTHTLFMDGFVVGGPEAFTGTPGDTLDLPLTIGAQAKSDGTFTNFFGRGGIGGEIDEVEVFNRALADNEILDIFEAGSSGKCKPHDIAFKVLGGGGFTGPTTIRGGQVKSYNIKATNFGPAPEYIGAVLVVDPLSGCPAPTILVPDEFDLTPADDSDDTLFVDIDGDTVVESVAFARVTGKNGSQIAAFIPFDPETDGPVAANGNAKFKVFYQDCGPDLGATFDYKLTADICHSGDAAPKGFFLPLGGDCVVTQPADGGTDPDQSNDAKISRFVNDTKH